MSTVMNVGDKVSQVPNGFGEPFQSGSIVEVHENDKVTYDVLWDGFDWITVGWTEEELTLK